MKKRLGLLAIVLLTLGVTACGETPVDGAVAKLQTAYDSLSALIPDPSNITTGFEVPVTLANSVTAEWSSDEPGVISFGTPAGGFAVATVNRPAKDAGDAEVTISALLSLQSELSSEMLHQTWTIDLTVKQNTVIELVIDNIDDVLAITDKSYDGQLSVTLNDMTIFAKSAGEAFAYDGTGIIQIYAGAASTMVVGKVYTISGTADWYYGIWEITKSTATEQTSATPNYPTKEVITSVTEKINALVTAEEHLSAVAPDASAGNFEPIYARVTGKIFKDPADTSNYNTWIMDTTATALVAGTGSPEVPSNSLMVYYNTSDFNLVREYNGIVVTMDVVIYTYRSNNHAFAVYYVGGPAGIEATLTDEQKLTIDANSLSVTNHVEVASTLSLPVAGVNGSAIAWTSSNEAIINPTTGSVTLPETGNVTVTLTATVTYGSLTAVVKTFTVIVGPLEVTTMETLLTKAKGDVVYSEAEVLWLSDDAKSAIVGDTTGKGYIYNSAALSIQKGKFYGFNFTVDIYNGLIEMTKVTVLTAKGTDPNIEVTAATWTATEALALSATAWAPAYVTMELFGYADVSGTKTFYNGYLPGFGPGYVQTNGATDAIAGKKFTATGWIIGRSSGAVPSKVTIQGTYTNMVDATDAEKLAVSVGMFKAPTANTNVTANITLPTAVKFGSVAWTSSNEAVISTTGVVTRPAEGQPDATVTMSYVITVGAESTTAVGIEFTVKALEPVVVPQNQVVVNTLSGVSSISQLTSGGSAGATQTDATLSTLFTTASNKFASVTGSNKIYASEDTQAMKLGTSSVAGTFTVNMASGYVATKISVVFHAYKMNAATMTIAGGTETTATQSITAPTATDYTTGAATVELTSASGLSSFTIATTSTACRAFIYSITVDYIAVV